MARVVVTLELETLRRVRDLRAKVFWVSRVGNTLLAHDAETRVLQVQVNRVEGDPEPPPCPKPRNRKRRA